jgi:hypothetical protein
MEDAEVILADLVAFLTAEIERLTAESAEYRVSAGAASLLYDLEMEKVEEVLGPGHSRQDRLQKLLDAMAMMRTSADEKAEIAYRKGYLAGIMAVIEELKRIR